MRQTRGAKNAANLSRDDGFDVDGDDFFEYNDDSENRLRQVTYDSGRVVLLSHSG